MILEKNCLSPHPKICTHSALDRINKMTMTELRGNKDLKTKGFGSSTYHPEITNAPQSC